MNDHASYLCFSLILSARWAERAHYLDLIQIYTGLGDESDIDLILMHLPRVASDRERMQ
jgi:hypothetical protein